MTDGDLALSAAPFSFNANFGRAEQIYQYEGSTWNSMGVVEGEKGVLGRLLTLMLDEASLSDVTVARANTHGPAATRLDLQTGSVRFVAIVDEDRGFIPLESEAYSQGRLSKKAFTTDIRPCSNARWFPTRCVLLSLKDGMLADIPSVREITVDELDIDEVPSSEYMEIDIPAGYAITTPEREQFKLRSDIKVDPSSLTTFLQRARDNSAGFDVPAAAPPNTMLIVTLCSLGALCVFVAFYLRRRKSIL